MDVVLVLSKHVSDSMNQYKQAWMSNVGIIHDNSRGEAKSETSGLYDQVFQAFEDHAKETAQLAVVMGVLGHMAQSQFSGTPGIAFRTIGRVGIRALPIIGAVATAYTIYKWLD